MTHAVLPIRRSDAADISNVYLPVREDLFSVHLLSAATVFGRCKAIISG